MRRHRSSDEERGQIVKAFVVLCWPPAATRYRCGFASTGLTA